MSADETKNADEDVAAPEDVATLPVPPSTPSPLTLLRSRMEEVLGEDDIVDKLNRGQTLRVYWGTAPTGPPSLAYYLPLLKLKELLTVPMNVTILLADVHSYMDLGLSEFVRTTERATLYEAVLQTMLRTVGVNPDDVEFVRGTSYQLDPTYCRDLFRLSAITSVAAATKASSEVVKATHGSQALLSHLLYPLMQALDETYLAADIELGGRDQRKIMAFARDHVHRIGYSPCAYVITPLIPSLRGPGRKMSSSDAASKISFQDSDEVILDKVRRAYCVDQDGDLQSNPLLALAYHVLFPCFAQLGPYASYEALRAAWLDRSLLAQDLKALVGPFLVRLVAPVRQMLDANPLLYTNAYG